MAELALNNNHSLTHLIYSFLLPLWYLQNLLVYILENFEDKKGVSFHTNMVCVWGGGGGGGFFF